jgi:hypothetical protein
MTPDLRLITIRQPWAWAVPYAGKSTENRTGSPARWSYRGLIGIHAGAAWSKRGAYSPLLSTAWWAARGVTWGGFCPVSRPQRVAGYYVHPTEANPDAKPGEVIHFARCIAVAHLTDVHPAAGCCEPWGEDTYTDHQGRLRTDVVHLHLEDIRPLAEPVHVPRGQLGLWTPTSDLHEDILEAAGL